MPISVENLPFRIAIIPIRINVIGAFIEDKYVAQIYISRGDPSNIILLFCLICLLLGLVIQEVLANFRPREIF